LKTQAAAGGSRYLWNFFFVLAEIFLKYKQNFMIFKPEYDCSGSNLVQLMTETGIKYDILAGIYFQNT